ncbi:MAG: AMP-binding protein, partial [Gammaproteobacteria bacterium]|nr:AMP-binding protein [Gammaproteobacteria bacterium]
LYFNVPAGYDALLNYLEADVDLRDTFFRNLDIIYSASASLGDRTRQRLNDLSRKAVGTTLPLLSGWGATETAPLATGTWLPTDLPGAIGQPIPGTEIKLKPFAEKYEIRVRGVNVFPGYWRQPRLTEDVFDSEGFYKIGDAAVLADDNDPNAGIIFKGRTAEEFKLDTGSWVSVGILRLKIIGACAPLIQDAVIAGQDRHEIAVLLVPDIKVCVEQLDEPQQDSTLAKLAASDELRQQVRQRLQKFNADHPASSTRVGFFDLVDSPLNIDSGEMTDKRYINQRGVRESRHGQIEAMYGNEDYRVGEH